MTFKAYRKRISITEVSIYHVNNRENSRVRLVRRTRAARSLQITTPVASFYPAPPTQQQPSVFNWPLALTD